MRFSKLPIALIFACVTAAASFAADTPTAAFIPLEQARPVLQGMAKSVPPELAKQQLDANAWSRWVQWQDRQVRERLLRGEEDTITNLLRFGVTFTKEVRIDREYLAKYGSSTLVNSFANHRADDLVRALAAPNANEGIKQARALLEQQGYKFNTQPERARLKKHLLDNLARMRDEFQQYREKLKTADVAERAHLYAERGISLDSNLWPDYALEQSLREMLQKGLLKPGSVRRVAIVGPGLDFANKEYGNDFYPPQSIQPFAVLDSLGRLGLSDPAKVDMYTLDISPSVNIHLHRASQKAAAGTAYTMQLPWSSEVPFSPGYLAAFMRYWQGLGSNVGTPVKPATVPGVLAENVHIRAVKVRPELVKRIKPVDMNIVFQQLPGEKFDLIIGTNIFIYYDAFEQSLARVNLAAMLNPDGMVMSNNLLASDVPSQLDEVHRTKIAVRTNPDITEYVFCYRRK